MKCKVCGRNIDPDSPYVSLHDGSGGIAHPKCFNSIMGAVKTKRKTQAKEREEARKEKEKQQSEKEFETIKKTPEKGLSEQESAIKRAFFQKLSDCINNPQFPAYVYKIAQDYIKDYGFTYEGMTDTLHYYCDILGRELSGDGMGIIPYYYDKALEFFANAERVNRENEEIIKSYGGNLKNMYPTRTYKPRLPNRTPDLIDIEQIGRDAECS